MGRSPANAGILGDLVSMIAYHVLGAATTIFLRESSDDAAAADPVRASLVVGLMGLLVLEWRLGW